MRLRFIALLILIAVAASLIGCAKLIDTQEEIVEATIVDTRFYAGYYTSIKSGKVTVMQWHPARYYTTLEYNGISTDIFGSDLYSICHGKDGDTIQCSLITETYDDGTVKQFLEWRK
jgi:hypothetical protein